MLTLHKLKFSAYHLKTFWVFYIHQMQNRKSTSSYPPAIKILKKNPIICIHSTFVPKHKFTYMHIQLNELTLFLWCVVTRNRTSASKSLGTLSTNSWWDTRKYTILRAKATSKLASHSLRKIVDVNMLTT